MRGTPRTSKTVLTDVEVVEDSVTDLVNRARWMVGVMVSDRRLSFRCEILLCVISRHTHLERRLIPSEIISSLVKTSEQLQSINNVDDTHVKEMVETFYEGVLLYSSYHHIDTSMRKYSHCLP